MSIFINKKTGEVVTASSKSEVLASSFDYIGTTYDKDNTILCQGQNKNAVDKLFDKIEELGDVDIDTSFHNLVQLNYNDELPDEVTNLLNNKREFKILKKQDNRKLQNQLEELEDLFRKENLSITGDMGLAFQDSSDIPAYVDHFCVTFNKDKKNEKEYIIVCANGGFDIHDYDDEASNILTFEKSKKKCQELINKYIRKVTSSSKVTASSKSAIITAGISRLTEEAYKALNERFTNLKGKVDEDELEATIRLEVLNDPSLESQLRKNSRTKAHSLAWQALINAFNTYLEWYECAKHNLTSEQVKGWFKYNNSDFKKALEKSVKMIEELREDD